jgi:hypothetical protein
MTHTRLESCRGYRLFYHRVVIVTDKARLSHLKELQG